ncbi:unnamed protein product [Medioppia subpectinata]|uniref:Cytochrome P450 n=1 Tax=Medioppia subpectinata TaxID=1979941 RepID=A0A7R9PV77_9ACAR|nr:unnamed protein product [Medioppia subpectinata]CAG2102536.1 unnamed protein product [Medioppia subpectinata]
MDLISNIWYTHPYITSTVVIITSIAMHGVPGPCYMEIPMFEPHHEYTQRAYKKYGRVYGAYDLTRRTIAINDPELLKDIMVKDFHIFPDHKHFHMGSSKINQSIFLLPGNDQWKRIRSIMSPAFSSGKLKAMMAHISDFSDTFVKNLDQYAKSAEPFNIRDKVGAFAMDVISACAYGINIDSINNPDHPVVVNAKKILGVDSGWRQVLGILAPGVAKFFGVEFFDIDAANYFDTLTNQILKERKHNNKYTNSRRTDFVQLMINSEKSNTDLGYDSNSDVDVTPQEVAEGAAKKPKGTLTPDELTAQGMLLYIAGYDTTSASIANAVFYLSQNPECQRLLAQELKACDEFTYEKLVHLKYLNAVINETVRLSPSLTRNARECLQDYKLGNTGITIPKGTSVEIYPHAIQRDPEFWPEPDTFKPDRWFEPKHHPMAFQAFGAGPRVCIGQRFAMNEMRMCLAKLIHRYDFTLAQEPKLDYMRWRFTYWARHGVPGPNYMEMPIFEPHHTYVQRSYKKYGRVYGGYDLTRRTIAINDPELLKDIMVKDFHIFPDHKHFHTGNSKISQSIFFLPGNDQWKRIRSIMTPAFSSGKLKAMMSHISDYSDTFLINLDKYAKSGEAFNIRDMVGAFAMDVISACAYGINIDTLNNPDHPVVVNAKKILGVDVNWRQVVGLLIPGLAKMLKLEFFDIEAATYFDKLTNQILKERKHNNKYTNSRRTDFIQLMIDSEKSNTDLGYDSNSDADVTPQELAEGTAKKPKGTLTPDELTAQGMLLYIAGYDTTSASIANAVFYLSQSPECQRLLAQELIKCNEFTYEKLVHLKYLNAVINETLRLSPSLVRNARECLQDYKLGNTGITIPKGTSVEIYPHAIHRDPEFWPEPDTFKPDRWFEPKHHPMAFQAFGAGPRVCIGQRFAMNEMRMCLAKLIHRYEFTLAQEPKLE